MRKRVLSESTEERESRLSKIQECKKAREMKESNQQHTQRLEREKQQARVRMQALRRRKQQMHATNNTLAKNQDCAESVPISSIVSQCKVRKPSASISESSGGLKSELVTCDELDMDSTVKQDPSSHNSGKDDIDMDEMVMDCTAPVVQMPAVQFSLPSNQDIKLRHNKEKFEKAILEGPTHKCHSCERLCYGRLGATYSWDVASELLTVMNESVEESVESVWFCNKCKNVLQRNKVPAGSQFNKMKVAEIPSVLLGLNTLEERLISKATVFMKMVILPRGGQRAVRGQVINFPSNVDSVISQLPRLPHGEDIVYVQQPESADGRSNDTRQETPYHTCRYSKVMQALQWLKQHNILYSDVTITDVEKEHTLNGASNDNGPITEGDGNVLGEQDSIEMDETGIVRLDALQPNVVAADLLQEDKSIEHQVHQLQRVTATPLSIFEDRRELEVLAFPTLYPDGENGFGTVRNSKISPLEYFQTRILSADSRWARHPSYIFWACNIVEALKLQSSISIAMRMRSFTESNCENKADKKTEDIRLMTAGSLRGRLNDNPHLRENCYSFMRDIRGTQAYWNSVKIQLYAMFRTLGPPTFFVTLSADDNNWVDLMVVLSKSRGQNLSEQEAANLSDSEKRELMRTNPVVTARHFAHRFQCFLREVIKGSGQPIGEVVDYFWRIEFQLRGSPHVHSMWWIKDAPNLDTAVGRQIAPQFIDRYISVNIPQGCQDEELRSLVLRVQQHRHTATCTKVTQRRRNAADCRFDFPQPLSEETRLKSHDDPGNKSRFYVLKRSAGEENCNPYNANLLKAWKANMDIQLIGSVYGTAAYVCSYMCKSESEEVRKAIRDALESLPPQASTRKRLSKIGNTMLTHRELSAQEAAYRLCHLPLKENSRKVVFLNTARPEKRTRLLKCRSELLELEDDSTDIFAPGIFDRYASRPDTAQFAGMTLAHFAVWYELDSKHQESNDGVAEKGAAQPRSQLQNDMGWLRLRRKQACLRIPVQTPESHGDDYYYSLLLLYLPWRKEPEDLLQGHSSAMEAFIAREGEMVVLNAQNHSFADEVRRAVVQLQALEDDAYQDAVAPMAQQAQREDAAQPSVEAEAGLLNPEHFIDGTCLQEENVDAQNEECEFLNDDDDAIGAMSRQTLSDKEFKQLVASLNTHQRIPFDIVVQYTRELHKHRMKVRHDMPDPFHLFVTGGAGTGKSHVIRAIREHLERSVSGGPDVHACMLMAPTGVAAFNIGGLTIHRALRLQVEHGRTAHQLPLNGLALHDLRKLWQGVHTIVIDEISMVSYQILKSIHSRLCEIYGNDEIFGGLNVIAVGDLYQLSPVNGSFVFSQKPGRSSGRLASHLWRDFFKVIELKVNMRQQNDASFSEILNRIRTGMHTNEDMKVLQTRLVSSGNVDLLAPPFDTALRLYPRTVDVDNHNEMEIAHLAKTTQLYTIEAEHAVLESRRQCYAHVNYNEVPERLIPQDDKDCAALPRRLKLSVGARVMLRRNINCGDGLVNGARGTIVGFKWPGNALNQSKPGEIPTEVYVQFLDPKVGRLSKVPVVSGQQDVVPIQAISAKFYGKEGTVLQRTQMPLILCWAATVHKVQGLSLDAAVMDLGTNVFEPGMAYVALSRVRTLNGVALLNFQPRKITANKRVHDEMARLRQESVHDNDMSHKKQTLSHLVQKGSHVAHSEGPQDLSVQSSDILVQSEKQISQSSVCNVSHGKNVSTVPMVVKSLSSTNDVDLLVFSLQTSLQYIVNANSPSTETIVQWAGCHNSKLQTIMNVVNCPSRATFSNLLQVDVVVQKKLLPAFTSEYLPVCTKGGGNCMYNMVSLALSGTEQFMWHLRLLTAYSFIVHKEHMVEIIKPTATIHLPHQNRDAASVARAAEKQWLDLLRSSIHESSWGNQFHLHALAVILKRSIWLYGVMQNRTLQHEGRQLPPVKDDVTRTELQALFQMGDKRLNNSICYRSATDPEENAPLLGFLDSSHFTAILPVESASLSQQFAPFTTFMSLWAPEL